MFIRPLFGGTEPVVNGTYDPGMMDFALGRYYDNDFGGGLSGNKATGVVRWNRDTWAGTSAEVIMAAEADGGKERVQFTLYSTDAADPTLANRLVVTSRNTAGTTICQLVSKELAVDSGDHIAAYSFDGDLGIAKFTMDGVDADDLTATSRIAPTTGTLPAAGGQNLGMGRSYATGTGFFGKAGFAGVNNLYRTNHLDFMEGNMPRKLDEVTWTEWGSQPAMWHRNATMNYHKGTGFQLLVQGTEPAYISGQAYDYPKMVFDGTARYRAPAAASFSGPSQTLIVSVDDVAVDAGSDQFLVWAVGAGAAYTRLRMYIPTNTNQIVCRGQTSGGTLLFRLRSTTSITDGADHVIQFEYDTAGTVTWLIDGVPQDDLTYGSRVAPIAGTLGDTTAFAVGDNTGLSKFITGKIGYFGYDNTIGHDPDTYYSPTAFDPIEVADETTWQVWNKIGTLTDNKGTEGNFITDPANDVTGPA